MPPLTKEFRARVDHSIALARAGELARTNSPADSVVRKEFHLARLETLYEIAFLRIFVAWESFLEDVFHRYLCGFSCRGLQAPLKSGITYSPTIAHAQNRILGHHQYVLWHNPVRVIQRSATYFDRGPHEVILGSCIADLQHLASVRHRIAHAHTDARRKFDATTSALAGRRYRGAAPGRFLRDFDPTSNPPGQWLARLGSDLCGVAAQLA